MAPSKRLPIKTVTSVPFFISIPGFARGTEQILAIIEGVQEAASDPNFGQVQNSNLIEDLTRRGAMESVPVNGWGAQVRVIGQSPLVRIEDDVPSNICRHLADYFIKDADDLKLRKIETSIDDSIWRAIFDRYSRVPVSAYAVQAACGNAPKVTVAFVLQMR
jgi:hypothetical protein